VPKQLDFGAAGHTFVLRPVTARRSSTIERFLNHQNRYSTPPTDLFRKILREGYLEPWQLQFAAIAGLLTAWPTLPALLIVATLLVPLF
jgi:hypothetical protein